MKKSIFLLAVGMLVSMGTSFTVLATTFRINNTLETNKAKKIYASLQEAHDDGENVTNGDTLLVEGTNIEYEGLISIKRLVIIGPGYFLTENPQSQANALPAVVQDIHFDPGSKGSIIIGLVFSSGRTTFAPFIGTDGIAVIRCYLTNGIGISESINDLVIMQNYIKQFGISIGRTTFSAGGIILKNNIIAADIAVESYATAPRIFTTVEHNIFLGNVKLITNSFRSNIIVSKTAIPDVPQNAAENNLMSNDQPTNGYQTYNETALFVGLGGSANSPDGQYRLKADSPYLMAGYEGSQPGIFGGNEPYIISGTPSIPTIYDLTGDVIGSKQNGLNITIKARTNP